MPFAPAAVLVLAALTYAYAAYVDFARPQWILDNLRIYGVPLSWLPLLGAAKGAGAVGLLAGLVVPALGAAAGIGLVLYFIGAISTVARSRAYSHLPFPMIFMLPAAGSLAVLAAT
ncbi:DoxX family protein [Blastococcus sp. TF02-8]|uniref:DoxX family protein n=1 Tax=Blastococcus sp. TF02-8 TaxID=2250574 RepID=UPI000DEB4CD3|nr:DoxX family protein [Blastococcus sp. TF02-8]RBY97592.1 DoxX family protein [Blastococcus sp. TF02-8]